MAFTKYGAPEKQKVAYAGVDFGSEKDINDICVEAEEDEDEACESERDGRLVPEQRNGNRTDAQKVPRR